MPFGTERVNEKTGSFATRFTFTDQEDDPESALLYYGARYYSATLGRFAQPDPLALLIGNRGRFERKADRTLEAYLKNPQNLNPYSYAINSPSRYIDPEGEIVFVPVLLAAWAITEFGLSAYDIYDATKIVADPDASITEKVSAVGFAGAGVIGPGGGYGQIRKVPRLVGRGTTPTVKALPLRPRLTQDRLDHIVHDHWHSSGVTFQNGVPKSRFSKDIDLQELRKLIDEAANSGAPWRVQGDLRVLKSNLGRNIGTDPTGKATDLLRVVVTEEGKVWSAYPIPR